MIRFLDILISIVLLVLFSPLFLLLSLLIVIGSKGGVVFKQVRIGKNSKKFKIMKFRTMFVGSEAKGQLTVGDLDNRITKIGVFLRKYKLDELPQLINVLKGEMSMVGPRPEVPKYVNLYSREQKKILSVRPGITDLASIEFANENEILSKQKNPEEYYIKEVMPRKIKLNMGFIEDPSVFNYVGTLVKTVLKVFR